MRRQLLGQCDHHVTYYLIFSKVSKSGQSEYFVQSLYKTEVSHGVASREEIAVRTLDADLLG